MSSDCNYGVLNMVSAAAVEINMNNYASALQRKPKLIVDVECDKV